MHRVAAVWVALASALPAVGHAQAPEERLRLYKTVVDGRTYAVTDPVGCVVPEKIVQGPGNAITMLVNKCSFPVSVVACVPTAEPVGLAATCAMPLHEIVYVQHRVLRVQQPGATSATGSWSGNSFRGANVVACRAGEGELREHPTPNMMGLGNPSSFWTIRKTGDGALTAKCLAEVPSSSPGAVQEWPFYKEIFGQSLGVRIAGAGSPTATAQAAPAALPGPARVPPSGRPEQTLGEQFQQRTGLRATAMRPSVLDLWEATVGNRTVFVDAEVGHAFEGQVFDARTRSELGAEQRAALRSASRPSQPAPARSATSASAVGAAFEKRYALKPRSVRPAPWGLWELVVDGTVAYVDSEVNFVLLGTLRDTASKQDVSASARDDLLRIDFGRLPLTQTVKRVNGNGSRVIAVFADPNCPFCRQLERSLSNVPDLTVHVFLYPVLGGTSAAKSHAVWCAPDRALAWREILLGTGGEAAPVPSGCQAPVEEVLGLGRSLNVTGTPTIFLPDGRRITGAVSPAKLEELLRAAPAR